jgi:hypothetical protein
MIRKAIPTMLVLALGSFLLLGLPGALAQAPPSPTPRYRIYGVTTELQRRLIPVHTSGKAPPETQLLVVVDTTATLRADGIAVEGLSLSELWQDLSKRKVPRGHLHITVYYPPSTHVRTLQEKTLVRYALMGMAHDAGFPTVTSRMDFRGMTWEDYVDSFAGGPAREPKGDEAARGDDVVKVYPVQTELSRYLSRDADCVVVFAIAAQEERWKIPYKVWAAAAKAIAELKLAQKKQITFLVQGPRGTDEEDRELRADLQRFAEVRGFDRSLVER